LNSILSRHAECIFWLARQVERSNSTARILDINESFSRNARGEHDWESVLRLYGDEKNFRDTGRRPTADAVIHFYILDEKNPNSVLSSIGMARENARALRPLISTEMWVQLNSFHNRLRRLRKADLRVENLNRLCSYIKESCQTHSGITAETLYRDESWYFHQIGRAIERADQTTRLVDVKYQVLLPQPSDVRARRQRASARAATEARTHGQAIRVEPAATARRHAGRRDRGRSDCPGPARRPRRDPGRTRRRD
jgi:uncharacterized alpha-E superfamily protein